MVHRLSFFLIWGAVVWAVEAARPAYILSDPEAKVIVKVTDAADQKKYGGQLVASMNTTRAAQAINATGKMRIRDERGKPKDVGVVFRTAKLENTLVSMYSTVHETLTITVSPGLPTLYKLQPVKGEAVLLKGAQAMKAFSGSDFWLADLGLEFLHWPTQAVRERRLRRGELCSVLVSQPAKVVPGGYSKIISWVDEDSLGIVRAEAFDAKGKLLKVFTPNDFQKINGQWTLKEMEMRNEQTFTRTLIQFDFKKEKKN